MKKTALWLLFLAGGFLIPAIGTMLLSGRIGEEQQKMGITVVMEDGTEIDGEQFVIGMAASELSYIKEEEALKAWMIVCRTNFVKAATDDGTGTDEAQSTAEEVGQTAAEAQSTAGKAEQTVAESQNTAGETGQIAEETLRVTGEKIHVQEKNLSLDYISMDELEENNGRKTYLELKKMLEDASDATFGEVLCYKGEYIDALYHQVSIGKTVSSEEIYDVPVDYLVSVDSSQDVESDDYMQVKTLGYDECAEKLKETGYEGTAKKLQKKLKIAKHTENGFVEKVTAGDSEWTGDEWKQIFSLNSTNFYLEDYEGKLRIVAIGKGHDMGMSLYGANALAKKELSEATILSYYYPGTEIKTLE